MASLDDELALFESEISSIVAETATSSSTNNGPTTSGTDVFSPPVPPVLSSSAGSAAGNLVPQQLRLPPMPVTSITKSAVTIESAPTKYSEQDEEPMPIPQTFALPADILYVQHKRNLKVFQKKERWDDDKKKKKFVRCAGGQTWEDNSLSDWDSNDFRVFCGDLGNEVSDELLAKAFRKYPSFLRARVIRDGRTNKSKGYGFISFKNAEDYARAMREMDGKYVGNRPIKLRKSNWKDRNMDVVKTKQKEKVKLGLWA